MTINPHLSNHIALEAIDLRPGESRRSVCPVCGDPSKTFSVYASTPFDGRVFGRCFRASCNVWGYIGQQVLASVAELERATLPKRLPPTSDVVKLTEDQVNYLLDNFLINETLIRENVRWSERQELVIDQRAPNGKVRGYVYRVPVWKGIDWPFPSLQRPNPNKPKSQSFWLSDTTPHIGWFRRMGDEPDIVIVEDAFSAMSVAAGGAYGVSLNGIGMSLRDAQEIANFARERLRVYIALDPGAEQTALKLYHKWVPLFHTLRVVFPEKDPKYIGEVFWK